MKKQFRKSIAIAAAVCISVNALCAFAALQGDVDNSGKLDGNDVRTVQNFILGKKVSLSGAADMNNDGRVNGFDLAALKKKSKEPAAPSGSIKDFGTAPNTNATMYDNFRTGKSEYFFASDGWTNGNPFDCGWVEGNTKFEDGALTLTIDKDPSGKYNYTGAEYRTTDHYHYGYYETSMQAIKNDGVVSSFFTYTGPSEDNPWDEIDIEILGKDTTKVQLNYYTNGVGNHEFMYDLGFDASEGYHTYGFDWQPDHITWYVDGKEVYTARENIPSTPGRIMMNTWPGIGVNEWLKPFDGKTPLTARYQWVTYDKSDAAQDPVAPTNPPASTDNVQYTAPSGGGMGVTENFEGTGTDWTGRGTVKYGFTSDFKHAGAKSLYVTNRTATWHGIAVTGSDLEAGATYDVTAYVAYKNDQFPNANFGMGLQYDLNGETKYDAVADASCTNGQWAALKNSSFTIPAGATNISLYVQSEYKETASAGDLISFFLDDVTLVKKSSGNNNNNPPQNPGTTQNNIKDFGTAPNTSATMYDNFRTNSTKFFFASDGWTNGNPFDCVWTKNNTKLENGYLSLTIDKDPTGKYHYTGAEYRTTDHYHYGYYETSMQAIKNDGVVSSFFTYTGPSEDNPWDEIDIEILGKDTTKVQLNYYTNGVGNHEFMYDLGFDASEGFHTYGFDWQPDHITWYVDGKAVYTARDNIPKTPSRIMMNAWPGIGVNEWLNAFNGKTPLTARYQWVTYTKK